VTSKAGTACRHNWRYNPGAGRLDGTPGDEVAPACMISRRRSSNSDLWYDFRTLRFAAVKWSVGCAMHASRMRPATMDRQAATDCGGWRAGHNGGEAAAIRPVGPGEWLAKARVAQRGLFSILWNDVHRVPHFIADFLSLDFALSNPALNESV
jgi:hypothetical protein